MRSSSSLEVNNLFITNVYLAQQDPALADNLWTVYCQKGKVVSVTPYEQTHTPAWNYIDGQGSILLPSYVALVLQAL